MKKKKTDEIEEQGDAEAGGSAVLSGWDTKKVLLRRILANVRQQVEQMDRLLESGADFFPSEPLMTALPPEDRFASSAFGRAVEGVFDGEQMVGEDGQRYQIPPNYASKSKLVEGDFLRLTITENGKFLYKQRGPIERQRVMGMLMQDEHTDEWKVLADGRKYSVLTASVTFFHGQAGDEAIILIPRDAPSHWAAIENIVRRSE
mgnify:FL=1